MQLVSENLVVTLRISFFYLLFVMIQKRNSSFQVAFNHCYCYMLHCGVYIK